MGMEEAEPGAKEAWVTSRAADDSWLERHCNRAPEPPRPIRSDREFEQQLSEYEGKYAAYFHAHQQLERGERDQRALWQARCASADPAHRAALESQLLAALRHQLLELPSLDRLAAFAEVLMDGPGIDVMIRGRLVYLLIGPCHGGLAGTHDIEEKLDVLVRKVLGRQSVREELRVLDRSTLVLINSFQKLLNLLGGEAFHGFHFLKLSLIFWV